MLRMGLRSAFLLIVKLLNSGSIVDDNVFCLHYGSVISNIINVW